MKKMKKEVLAKLNQNAENDAITLKEIMGEEKSIESITNRFSQKLTERHGAEFGGVLLLKYNKHDNKVELYCGQMKTPAMLFSPEDIGEIPHQVMLLRERKKKEAEVAEWNKSRKVNPTDIEKEE
ncbi:hypothetical protein COV21_00305 [Candidatus Woesearchaeota archaeon CG10_big_fil_rev_8_21_14_0_10_45_5]|nr:MAG: hypothetical protein COV21_00305 [Candidatus Woesearchaeota archaeon CG10_big_fil_rev_8_21_14_0_10_45_5]PIU29654.1 MAG: hypothetical protein COT07_04780 [Candidatus Woesearchaeota archaeon CG07_land_8_20_14_0_80_44_23]